MPRRSPFVLGRIVQRLVTLALPRDRELVRGMVAEIDSITDPVERTRFALGAFAAVARLTLIGYAGSPRSALGRPLQLGEAKRTPLHGGSPMSKLSVRELLFRHAVPFAISLASLTAILLANSAARRVPQLSAKGVPTGGIVEAVLLAVPHTVALTIPMAVLLAVSWTFTRLGADGILATVHRERHGIRRLVAPVLGAAAVIAGLTFVSNAIVVPRANARLAAVINGAPVGPSDRTMTIGELREASRRAETGTGAEGAARAAAYAVEVQKKIALAAACIVLALFGAAVAIRFPHGGIGGTLGSNGLVFTGYALLLVAGESLADQQMLSPLVAMWMANGVLVAGALLLIGGPGRHGPTRGAETLAINR